MNAAERIGQADIRAAIIDLDGTMLDTALDIQVAINRMRAELKLDPLTIETVTDFVGKGTENLISRVLAVDYEPVEVEQHFTAAMASYLRHYQIVNGDYSALYPGVKEGLDALQAKQIRLACVTNKPLAFANTLLEKKGLRSYFDIVYGGDSFAKKKPDPAPLLQV